MANLTLKMPDRRRSYLELWCCLLVFIEENRENNKLLIFIELFFSDRTQLVSARETQLVSACVWTWDTASPMMGQKCPIKKTRRINMIVASEHQTKLRQKEIQEIDRKASKEHEEAKKNSNFTQTYPKGWQRIRELVRDKQGAAAIGLYSFFAEHIDPTCGAVVCDQQFLANQMGVSTRTIRRWLDYLEEKGALVRIPVAGKVCAYALDPHEVWKGYNTSKDYSAFVTKTLVNKDGEIKRRIMAMFSGEESGQEQ